MEQGIEEVLMSDKDTVSQSSKLNVCKAFVQPGHFLFLFHDRIFNFLSLGQL